MSASSFVSSVIFAAVAFFGVVLLEFLLLFGLSAVFGGTWSPRGLGWIIMPFSAAAAGWALGSKISVVEFFSIISRGIANDARALPQRYRSVLLKQKYKLWIGFSGLWLLISSVYLLIFEPFGRYYWRTDEYLKATLIMFGPVVIAAASISIMDWAKRDHDRSEKPK